MSNKAIPSCQQIQPDEAAMLNNGEYSLEELFGVGGKPTCPGCDHCREQQAPIGYPSAVQMAAMPVDRCYDVRAKMLIAFNECKKAGGGLDGALDAAYKAALRYSPSPNTPPVTMPDRKTKADYSGYIEQFQSEAAAIYNSALEDVGRLNGWKA